MPINFRGLSIANPINRLAAGLSAMASNVRAYLKGTVLLRNQLSSPITTFLESVQTLTRLNDSTPAGPADGYSLIGTDSGGNLYCYNSSGLQKVAVGLSGNPVSIVNFRPNASVQPWSYVFDSAPQGDVTITTKFAISGDATTFVCNGSLKVRSDGLVYKAGIEEPQVPPIVGTGTSTITGTDVLPATAMPWTNRGGVNADWNFGGTETAPDTNPVVILTPVAGSTVTLVVTGTATVNGASGVGPGASAPASSDYPGNFLLGGGAAVVVMGAFTDAFGNVIGELSAPTSGYIYNVGSGVTLTVPPGAAQLHLGIDSHGGDFSLNSGSYSVAWTVSTSAIASNLALLGNVTAYYWGDSPHTGPVASYIWKNPNDIGSGTPRTIGDAAGSATNNSLIFDSTPEDGTVPVQWDTLSSTGGITGSIVLFSPALESAGYQDFNCCIIGSFFVPAAGTYTFTIQNKDQVMFGIGGGATVGSGTVSGISGQTETVVSALPLLYVSTPNGEGGAVTQSISVTFPNIGAYQFEVDWDYWYHTGRSLIITASPTPGAGVATIPPLQAGTREDVSYAVKYRSSLTGAQSNPSPVSAVLVTPVIANTIQAPYSPDPQVDKCDYYRQDSSLANYTYIGTGPNDGLGGTIAGVVYNTAIIDELSDTAAAGNQIMQYDDFEPVPSIDLPQSGVVNVSQGEITWVSGDQFNIRWLPGTVIEIGSPTQLAYTLYARPTSTTTMYIPSVPDGTDLVYNIAEPILAAQPLPYLSGPTDNINYAYAVGDSYRPGTMYWCKGSNLDSWPDTNQQDVTDPGEPLNNVALSGGRGVLASIKRFWAIMPNFFNAVATVTGVEGSTWTLQNTAINRGLFIPRCIAVEGGGNVFFRVDDGIHVSPGGLESKSITDESLYPIFPHEGSTPVPVVRNGITIYPPDDTNPEAQKLTIQNAYLYWQYEDASGTPRVLVFDIAAMGWIWDSYSVAVTCGTPNEGESVQGILVGCNDGSVRQLVSTGGAETTTGMFASPAMGNVGWAHTRLITVEYLSNAPITMSFVCPDASTNGSIAPVAITLPSTSGTVAKLKVLPTANKWKLLQCIFTFTDPTAQIYLDGLAFNCKPWGSNAEYQPVNPFDGSSGGFGGQP
jgi:hypothetical protein